MSARTSSKPRRCWPRRRNRPRPEPQQKRRPATKSRAFCVRACVIARLDRAGTALDGRRRHFMEKRRLGKSDLMIAPVMLGGNVFGWTAPDKHGLRNSRRLPRCRLQRHRHGRCLFGLDSGPQGRRIRNRARQLDGGARKPRQGRARDQGRHAADRRQGRAFEGAYRRGGRGFAQAASDRLYRSLLRPSRR